MGLDMYLYKKTYVKKWKHIPKEEQYSVSVKRGGKKCNIRPARITYITEEVMYWRKFNALHAWFIRECADGNDDCREVDVSREKMNELYTILNEIKNNHSKADELLPTQSGFFFGSTIYDKWYYSDILETIKVLQYELDENGLFVDDYIYHASW